MTELDLLVQLDCKLEFIINSIRLFFSVSIIALIVFAIWWTFEEYFII